MLRTGVVVWNTKSEKFKALFDITYTVHDHVTSQYYLIKTTD